MNEIKRYLPASSMILTQSALYGTYVSSGDHEAEIDRLRDENERLARDAARYRWLRGDGLAHIKFEGLTTETCDVGLDFAVDAAMEAK